MTIREISKAKTSRRNGLILKMLLRKSVKEVASLFYLTPSAIYLIAFRHKRELDKYRRN